MVLGSLVLYWSFFYDLARADFIKLISLYVALFYLAHKLIQLESWNPKFLWVAGILFRLVPFLALPNLSQDFYRFIWDGELLLSGQNPYLQTPNDIMAQGDTAIANAQTLYDGMGSLSARHFSNYPPLNQVFFAIAAFLSGGQLLGAVIVLHLIMLLADLGILHFGRKLLIHFKLDPKWAFWYFLNPLVIVELSGNLHFEGVMLFFFVWALFLLAQGKWAWAALPYAASILVKLVPLLLLPVLFKFLGFKKSAAFYTLTLVLVLVGVAPFFSESFVNNYQSTVGLWFSNFEFNASLYNFLKWSVTHFTDIKNYELIKTVGSITPWLTLALALAFTFIPKNKTLPQVATSMLWVLTLYYFISTTVHPWYPIFLLVLFPLTRFRYPILWSLTVILSYTAYMGESVTERPLFIVLEYLAVFGFIFYELTQKQPNPAHFFKK
jgi:hypothetical protein